MFFEQLFVMVVVRLNALELLHALYLTFIVWVDEVPSHCTGNILSVLANAVDLQVLEQELEGVDVARNVLVHHVE